MEQSRWMADGQRGSFLFSKETMDSLCSLADMAGRGQFDETFLEELVRFHRSWPESEKYEFYYANYAMAFGALDVALEYAEKAYRKRKVSREIWELLTDILASGAGNRHRAWFYEALCSKHFGTGLHKELPQDCLDEFLRLSSYAMSEPWKAPELSDAMFFDGKLRVGPTLLVGRFLPEWPGRESTSQYRYWCGIWNDRYGVNWRGQMLEKYAANGIAEDFGFEDTVFDLMKSCKTDFFETHKGSYGTLLVPLAGTEADQEIRFRTSSLDKDTKIGKFSYNFFRLEEATKIFSDRPFLVGMPVVLGHHPRRCKFILNILLDGFSWSEIKRQDYRCIPNMMRFFREGIIFDANYSVAEYTYPSLATIETGRAMQTLQVFNPKAMVCIEQQQKPISERMAEAGYYCVNVMGDGEGVYNGVTRGYHRLLVAQSSPLEARDGVERVIRHLEAFSECDNFLFLHVTDAHPKGIGSYPSLQVQTRVSLAERLEAVNDVVSVWLAKCKVNEYDNRLCIEETDRLMGYLFDYITRHYEDDSYAVHLYSDHGASVFSDEPWFLSEEQSHAAFMMRGKGIPHLGRVEELTSCMDVYPSVLRNAGLASEPGIDGNLPAALGGKEREYVVSTSIYPLQTFKLCIRDKRYEFRLETDAATDIDGTVDFSKFSYAVYTRDAAHELVKDAQAEQRFLEQAEHYARRMGKCL